MLDTTTLAGTSLCCLLQIRKSLLPVTLCDHCVTIVNILCKITLDTFSKYFYFVINTVFFKKVPWQSLASPLLCSDDACAPRNTVAVATCSLTILCFYCPVPYSTLLCLAELDEHLLFKTDRQHLFGQSQLSFN